MCQIDTMSDFNALDPNTVLQLVEESLGIKMTLLCRPYTSYINRVYELQSCDGQSIVAKFYRPGRWSKEALQEEHDFLRELNDAEIPVIAPLVLSDETTLCTTGPLSFALFPKKGGRSCDELRDEEWLQIGRLLGRVHQIGATRTATHRIKWNPGTTTQDHVDYIVRGEFVPSNYREEFITETRNFIDLAEPKFEGISYIRIHGDLHFSNLIYRPEESFFLIDFDDMVTGPAVQDLWMLLPGYRNEVQREINLFVEGYETFREFPFSELKLIEFLRAMRYIHFCAWCAHQSRDDQFLLRNPNWGTSGYWQQELTDLRRQVQRIQSDQSQAY